MSGRALIDDNSRTTIAGISSLDSGVVTGIAVDPVTNRMLIDLPSTAATSAKQDDIITAIENVSGLQRSTNLEGGGKVSVGTTAVEVTFSGTPEAIIITADKDNTGILYVGKSNVASDGSNAITFLNPSDTLEIEYDDTSNAIYVVASAVSQNFWKGAAL